jgi:6-pyruvoyltetrahydropterin/6-carboxytetrahydropterin synthase
MYRVNKQFEFQAAHVLSKHPGLCRFPHGHNYKVEITLAAESLDENNMVCDFQAIKAVLRDYVSQLDHSIMLNSADQAGRKSQEGNPRVNLFEDKDPTSEVMAETIFTFLREKLGQRTVRSEAGVEYRINPAVRLEKVRVWETPTAWAEYQP